MSILYDLCFTDMRHTVACFLVTDEPMLQGEWVSMGVTSDGSYGIEPGLIYSFPVQIKPDHTYTIVQGLVINDFARGKMDATMQELIQERDDAVKACQE